MTLADIAGWLLLSWETVKKVVQRRLEKDYRRIGYRKVPSIAIDELYQGRVRKYITLVIDMESGRIIWVGQGRGSGALREFWRRFKLSGTRFQAVAMDMSGAYAASVRAHAPHAILTFDRFHVMKLMNERLDELRRELVRQAQDQNAKEAIKGLRWLLLHRRDNLEKDASRRLQRSLRINQPLECAYLLKEELGELWQQRDGRRAWAFMRDWCAKAKGQRHPPTPSDGGHLAAPCQRHPQLLQDRIDQRQNGNELTAGNSETDHRGRGDQKGECVSIHCCPK